MTRSTIPVSIAALRLEFLKPTRHPLDPVDVEVDGIAWGKMPMRQLQERLEAADDFAVLVLKLECTTLTPIESLLVETPAEGLRNMTLDGKYMVPVKDAAAHVVSYRLPSPLPVGVHQLLWSYVWSPPLNRSTKEVLDGGVTLLPPVFCGVFTVTLEGLVAAPLEVHGQELTSAAFPGASLAATVRVQLPAWPVAVHLEGPPAGSVVMRLGGEALHGSVDTANHAPVPLPLAGTQELRIEFQDDVYPVTSLRLDPV